MTQDRLSEPEGTVAPSSPTSVGETTQGPCHTQPLAPGDSQPQTDTLPVKSRFSPFVLGFPASTFQVGSMYSIGKLETIL